MPLIIARQVGVKLDGNDIVSKNGKMSGRGTDDDDDYGGNIDDL